MLAVVEGSRDPSGSARRSTRRSSSAIGALRGMRPGERPACVFLPIGA